ncbi:beta-lactamase/transpeptidase-like protein [Pisolithus thermaeus]|nr:beta-lactamase/transpeptidase-like protein [Pisolithus croceorrhizus]KAI6169593.1 beta-lactamase/transpeptidase-like protein [Pisolithus thermaeus]
MAIFHPAFLLLGLVSVLTYYKYLNLLDTVKWVPESLWSSSLQEDHGEGSHGGKYITPEVATFIKDTMNASNITGLSVAVVPKSGEPELKAWGYRSEDGEKMTSDTSFHMASVSKAFCATALGILMDDFANGKNVTALPSGATELTWHTKVKDLLPGEWQLIDEWASERTNLKDILSHVTGVPRHDFAYRPYDTPLDVVRRLKHLRPAFELREQWSYNNLVKFHHLLRGGRPLKYAGQPYTSFVKDRIFVPLDMASSTFSPREAAASGKYTQGWTKVGRLIPEWFTEEIAFTAAGAGGVISSAVDMSKWISMWLNEGIYKGKLIIPASVYHNTTSSYAVYLDRPVDPFGSIGGYGLGWHRQSHRGYDLVGHTGAIPGVSTLASFLPHEEFGVLVFANAGDQDASVMSIALHILEAVLCLEKSDIPQRLLSDSRKPKFTDYGPTVWNISLPLDDFAGTYTNLGYGTITLCGPNDLSSYCSGVRADFAAIDGVHGGPSVPTELLAAWPSVWSSHVRVRHAQGTTFNLYVTSLFPKGYGKDSTPFETAEIGTSTVTAEFVVEDGKVIGFGVSGLVGRQTERARLGATVQERAEVWFDRV